MSCSPARCAAVMSRNSTGVRVHGAGGSRACRLSARRAIAEDDDGRRPRARRSCRQPSDRFIGKRLWSRAVIPADSAAASSCDNIVPTSQ